MDKKRTSSIPVGDIRFEMNEIHQLQQTDAKESVVQAGFTEITSGGAFTIWCC